MKQRTTDEWLEKTNIEYHERQFKEPYRSTVAFCDWLEKIGYIERNSQLRIMDLCSGQGANIYYMAKRYPKSKFVGVDINSCIVKKGNTFFKSMGIKNCHLEVGDIYNLDSKYVSKFHGIVSYQTLSWLPEFEEPIEAITKLDPQWIAITSLFYDGQVSCTIEVKEYDTALELSEEVFYYNIYSLPIIKKLFYMKGYLSFQSTPFEIDIDLPKPKKKVMGTYTKKLKDGHRLQISGPLLMPWYFVAAIK